MRSFTFHKVYSYLLILNSFILIMVSSVGSSWCFDLENIEEDQSFYVPNNCHSSVETSKSNFSKSHSNRNQPKETDCNFCLEYTFDDMALTGLLGHEEVPVFPLILATEFQPLPLSVLWDNVSTAEDYYRFHSPTPTTQKSLQTIVLLI